MASSQPVACWTTKTISLKYKVREKNSAYMFFFKHVMTIKHSVTTRPKIYKKLKISVWRSWLVTQTWIKLNKSYYNTMDESCCTDNSSQEISNVKVCTITDLPEFSGEWKTLLPPHLWRCCWHFQLRAEGSAGSERLRWSSRNHCAPWTPWTGPAECSASHGRRFGPQNRREEAGLLACILGTSVWAGAGHAGITELIFMVSFKHLLHSLKPSIRLFLNPPPPLQKTTTKIKTKMRNTCCWGGGGWGVGGRVEQRDWGGWVLNGNIQILNQS